LRDLPRFPLIIPSRPNAIRTLVETRLAEFGLKPQVALEIDAVPAILELVAEGHGYAVLSPRALERTKLAPALAARPIVQPRLASTLAIATSAQRPITPIQQAAIALVEELAGRTFTPAKIRAPARDTLSRPRRIAPRPARS
jgi:LysR family nitrogen assimilation transcriptional regulator